MKYLQVLTLIVSLGFQSLSAIGQELSDTPLSTPRTEQTERRDNPVSEEDIQILTGALELLSNESVWNREDDRLCEDDETSGIRSLFCALQKSNIDTLGEYDHRRVAMQEVRFAIQDATNNRKFEHRLRDYNNLAETSFANMIEVLQVARQRVEARLQNEN